jgi:diguanylate cyclase (GGDEF)-like protein
MAASTPAIPVADAGLAGVAALEALPVPVTLWRVVRDAAGAPSDVVLHHRNRAAAALLPGEAGDRAATLFGADLHEVVLRVAADGFPSAAPLELGPLVWELSHGRVAPDLVITGWHDVTGYVRREQVLGTAWERTASVQATLQTALDSTSDAFAVYDVVRDEHHEVTGVRLVMVNQSGADAFGTTGPDELVDVDLRDLDAEAVGGGLWAGVLEALERQATSTIRVHRHDTEGPWRAASDHTIAPVGEDRVVITWRDVTDKVRRERELELARADAAYAATHDPLTGLANRTLLRERLDEGLAGAGPSGSVAVVYADLDHFKEVNDSLGHAAGDELLTEVARRLALLVRTADTAARLGGDEFVLLLIGVPPDWDAAHFLERARAEVGLPVQLGGRRVRPSASFGAAVARSNDVDPEALLREADAAMYRAKHDSRR